MEKMKSSSIGTNSSNDFYLEKKDVGNNNMSSGFISWPPRHYACTFCSRKFKSAQALGGHMNVHRRDRAMLRQPPSWVNNLDFQNPSSPNPNQRSSFYSQLISSSSPSSASSHGEKQNVTTQKTQRSSPPTSPEGTSKKNCMRSLQPRDDDDGDGEFKVVRNGIVIRLDLEIGLLRDTTSSKEEELDLELRLGCS